jgi:hypothetical protein
LLAVLELEPRLLDDGFKTALPGSRVYVDVELMSNVWPTRSKVRVLDDGQQITNLLFCHLGGGVFDVCEKSLIIR